MVLRLQCHGYTLLLTGDLEGPGLEQLLRLPPQPVDVLMAPHHASKKSDPSGLARWARPKVVVACIGTANNPTYTQQDYTRSGAHFLGTWPHGAITVRCHAGCLAVTTFQTRCEWLVFRDEAR